MHFTQKKFQKLLLFPLKFVYSDFVVRDLVWKTLWLEPKKQTIEAPFFGYRMTIKSVPKCAAKYQMNEETTLMPSLKPHYDLKSTRKWGLKLYGGINYDRKRKKDNSQLLGMHKNGTQKRDDTRTERSNGPKTQKKNET